MPFTPSHAVVALPFIRTPLVPAAIAIGAMTPDLPIFVRGLGLRYSMTHSPEWIPLTMLIALVLLIVWRTVLRTAVAEFAPRVLADRLPREWDEPFGLALGRTLGMRGPERANRGYWPLLLASLLLGVASHMLWDAFTHEGRWGVIALPALDAEWGPMLGYKWLQHGSSAIGLAILGVWAVVWLARRSPDARARVLPRSVVAVVWLLLPVSIVIAWFVGLSMPVMWIDGFRVERLLYTVMPPACAIWGVLAVAIGGVAQVVRARRVVAVEA